MGDLTLFLPETIVIVGGFILLGLSALGSSPQTIWKAALAFCVFALGTTLFTFDAQGEPFFAGIYLVDIFSQILKVGLLLGLFLTLLLCRTSGSLLPHAHGEMPFFLFMATLGMMLLVSATELLTLYVSLELSAYGLYVMAPLHKDRRSSTEAGVKYVLYGAAASALTLYGISMVYGLTGSTYVATIMGVEGVIAQPLFLVGFMLILSGLFFKLAVFPFHAWAPDVYQGAPHQVATFIGTTSKVAAVGVLVRALSLVKDPGALIDVLMVLCIVSMTVGNLAAIAQKDIKRLLAYSTVAHAGYLLIGMLSASELGMASAIFYGLVYLVLAFCAFMVVCALGEDGKNPTMESLSGLYERSPFLAFVLLVGMFGLAGIPPTPGFAGKWFLFSAAMEAGHFGLVLVAAINATVSLYYYLQVVKQAYLAPAGEREPVKLDFSFRFAGVCAVVLVTIVGFYPGPLWEVSLNAAKAVLSLG